MFDNTSRMGILFFFVMYKSTNSLFKRWILFLCFMNIHYLQSLTMLSVISSNWL